MRIDLVSEAAEPEATNEDFAAATATTVVVLDGVTPLDRADTGCRHGVGWFARMLGTHFLAHADDPAVALSRCLATAIVEVRARHENTCDLRHPDSPAATVTAARFGPRSLEYLVLADSPLVLAAGADVTVVTDDRVGQVGRRVRARLNETGAPSPLEVARAVRARRNRADAYFVAADDPAVADEARTGCVPVADLTCVVLATDGAARLIEVFARTDWAAAVPALLAEGARAWVERTRAVERAEVERLRRAGEAARRKPYDDATIAVLSDVAHGPGPGYAG